MRPRSDDWVRGAIAKSVQHCGYISDVFLGGELLGEELIAHGFSDADEEERCFNFGRKCFGLAPGWERAMLLMIELQDVEPPGLDLSDPGPPTIR